MSEPRIITQANIAEVFGEAVALQAEGRLAEAADLWQAIVGAAPASAESWRNFADTLSGLGRFTEAGGAYERSVVLKPDAYWSHWGLAIFLQSTNRWPEAEAAYARAVALQPDHPPLLLDYGHAKLGLGDFAGGWPLYEHRKDMPGQGADRPPLAGEWLGEPLAGRRFLIWPEQGYGDQIQFVRYALAVRDLGAQVSVVCPPELATLFQTLPLEILPRTGSMTLQPPEHWALMLSLPGRLGVTYGHIADAPYLRVPQAYRDKWLGYAKAGSIGVAWRGRATHANDAHRSLPSAEAFAPLREAGATLVDLTEPVGDFADMAAILEQLDLVVTVDTAVGHLAGALGKPCWLLVPWYRRDWRWFQAREDSPWYAHHRLFHQSADGDWASVIERVARALPATATGSPRARS